MRAELVDDEGAGAAIAYLPGIGGTGVMMQPCAVRLRERFRVIRIRYAGGGDDTYEHLAGSIVGVLEERGVDSVSLLAESFGGGVALTTYFADPGRVGGLAIVNSFARYPWRARLVAGRALGSFTTTGSFRWMRRRFGARKLLGPRWRDPDLASRFASQTPEFDAAYRARLRMIPTLDLRSRLRDVQVPVSLFASEDDRVVPSLRCSREMEALLPDATLEVLSGPGHIALPLADLPWPDWMDDLIARQESRAATESRP